jgi:capsular polysaccharide export protein
MKGLRALGSLRLADPALRPLRARLTAVLEAGALPSPPPGFVWQAVGEEKYFSNESGPHRSGRKTLLVLEGPTPAGARRVPSSLLLLPLEDDATGGAMSPEAVVSGLVSDVLKSRETPGFDFADFWQTRELSCAEAGEPAELGPGGRALQAVLRGDDRTPPDHPLWKALEPACAAAGVPVTRVLNHLLVSRALWFSPYTGKPVAPAEAAAIFQTMLNHWQSNALPSHCYGAQYWNHPSIRATFSGQGGDVTFHETQAETLAAARDCGGRVLSWAGRTDPAFEAECAEAGVPLFRIEDGFLRSVGLGAGLARGAMLAVDDLGIYYDPSRPSRLERLLNDQELSPSEHKRGETLIDLISRARVSKYNFGRQRTYEFPAGRPKILVPGQVADDAAIRKSRSATIDCVNTPNVNLDLLRLARARHPDAFLIFKPHPDVETGLRKGRVGREEALRFADHIAADANIVDLIEAVDAVETFSSLSGFEALLRGRKVTVHGAPFYAGWGLCEDLTPLEGRGRQRDLPELVFLALVKYARTIDPVTLLPCSPEFLVERLSAQRNDRAHLFVTALKRHASWLGRKLGL